MGDRRRRLRLAAPAKNGQGLLKRRRPIMYKSNDKKGGGLWRKLPPHILVLLSND